MSEEEPGCEKNDSSDDITPIMCVQKEIIVLKEDLVCIPRQYCRSYN